MADAITKTGDLGPLPVYVGEAAHGREKGRDEIVDLFRRVAAHGEDVAGRLHSALKGHVDPTLHRTLYAESQIPEPDGGEGGDDAEEHPGTPEIPPTKPDDPKKPGDPDQPEKPDEGDKEKEQEKECAELREELKEVELSLEIANAELTDISGRLRENSDHRATANAEKIKGALVGMVQLIAPQGKVASRLGRAARGLAGLGREAQYKLPIPDSVEDALKYPEYLDRVGLRLRERFDRVKAEIEDLKSRRDAILWAMEQAHCG